MKGSCPAHWARITWLRFREIRPKEDLKDEQQAARPQKLERMTQVQVKACAKQGPRPCNSPTWRSTSEPPSQSQRGRKGLTSRTCRGFTLDTVEQKFSRCVLGPTASASPENEWEMQFLRLHPRPTKSETPRFGPSHLCFNGPWFWCPLRCEDHPCGEWGEWFKLALGRDDY